MGCPVLPGWLADCYQATAGPILLAGVPQNFLFLLALLSILVGILWPKILCVTAALYIVAFVGTRWEPYWYAMLKEYWHYERHYEA
jgi:hypothetical protein